MPLPLPQPTNAPYRCRDRQPPPPTAAAIGNRHPLRTSAKSATQACRWKVGMEVRAPAKPECTPEGQPRVHFGAYLFAQVPWRGSGGRLGEARRYALPRKVPRKAVWVEVRGRTGEGMCPGGAWEAGPGRLGITHFREKCHRRPFGWKCVEGREKECATEGPGRQVRRQAALRTSAKSATEGRLGGSA